MSVGQLLRGGPKHEPAWWRTVRNLCAEWCSLITQEARKHPGQSNMALCVDSINMPKSLYPAFETTMGPIRILEQMIAGQLELTGVMLFLLDGNTTVQITVVA